MSGIFGEGMLGGWEGYKPDPVAISNSYIKKVKSIINKIENIKSKSVDYELLSIGDYDNIIDRCNMFLNRANHALEQFKSLEVGWNWDRADDEIEYLTRESNEIIDQYESID